MDEKWIDYFPKNKEDAEEWTAVIRHTALDQYVLAVATTRIEGAWTCYIGKVEGFDHSREYLSILYSGSKLRESTALTLFPSFEGLPYAK